MIMAKVTVFESDNGKVYSDNYVIRPVDDGYVIPECGNVKRYRFAFEINIFDSLWNLKIGEKQNDQNYYAW